MSKKKESNILISIKKFFNVRAWFDFERIKAFAVYIFGGTKKLFVPKKQAPDESFEEVVKKMKLTETDLNNKKQSLRRLSQLMVTIAALIFIYAIYSLFQGNIITVLLSLVIMCVALVLGFRYHFWYFQISERKLGCTFREWYRKGLRGEHS